MKKIIIAVLLVLVVIFVVSARVKSKRGQGKDRREGIESIQIREGFPVELTPVKMGRFEVWREIQGKVEGYRQAFISTPDEARVAAIRYKVGDFVEADTTIISLDENDPKNISQVKLLRSVYEDARKEYERYESLYQSGGISQEVMEKVKLKLKTAKTNLETARSTVHLTSPIRGTLMALYVREGERVEKDKTMAIVSSLDQVRVVAAVSDRDVVELEVGQPVRVTSASGKEYEGRVDRVSLGANPDTGLFDLEMVLANPDRELKVGAYVTARVRVFYQEDAAYVDSRCVLRDFDGNDFVYQANGDQARKVVVERVAENEDNSLLKGLDPELPVVLSGKSLLKDGAKLLILNDKGESE
jgi:membrane fusion protein (multidrug efflux system)